MEKRRFFSIESVTNDVKVKDLRRCKKKPLNGFQVLID